MPIIVPSNHTRLGAWVNSKMYLVGRNPLVVHCTIPLIAMQGYHTNTAEDMGSLGYSHTYSKSMDQPGKVASPARRQLNRENEYFPVCVRPENLVSRGSAVPSRVSLLISILRRNLVLTYGIPPEFRGGVIPKIGD